MRFPVLAVSAIALGATSASAAVDIGRLDQNGDRFVTLDEVTAVLPSMTRSDFVDLDTNSDRRLSANEVHAPGAQSIFGKHEAALSSVLGLREIDMNNNNFASFSEIASAYPGFHATDFDDIDGNNDGRISATELYHGDAQAVVTRYESGSHVLVSLSEVDLDGSGFASESELRNSYPGLSRLDFHRIDANDDNRISFEELYALETIQIFGETL